MAFAVDLHTPTHELIKPSNAAPHLTVQGADTKLHKPPGVGTLLEDKTPLEETLDA